MQGRVGQALKDDSSLKARQLEEDQWKKIAGDARVGNVQFSHTTGRGICCIEDLCSSQ